MNLALGALSAVLAAAILAVLFVGGEEGSAASEETVATTQSGPTTTRSSAVSSSPDSTTAADGLPFESTGNLEGLWRTEDGQTVVQFAGSAIESIQSLVELDGEPATMRSTEAAQFLSEPAAQRLVQVIVFVTFETDARLIGPEPVLIELVSTNDGLSMEFEVADSRWEFVLRPD